MVAELASRAGGLSPARPAIPRVIWQIVPLGNARCISPSSTAYPIFLRHPTQIHQDAMRKAPCGTTARLQNNGSARRNSNCTRDALSLRRSDPERVRPPPSRRPAETLQCLVQTGNMLTQAAASGSLFAVAPCRKTISALRSNIHRLTVEAWTRPVCPISGRQELCRSFQTGR
jgi:hypothetical protein